MTRTIDVVTAEMIHPTFREFYEAVVLPLRRQNPTHRRLDGWDSGGNWEVAGRFRHAGRVWKVHADSHYEPLTLAYHALVAEPSRDPFVVAERKNGDRLDLIEELQRQRDTRFRHLYVYFEP